MTTTMMMKRNVCARSRKMQITKSSAIKRHLSTTVGDNKKKSVSMMTTPSNFYFVALTCCLMLMAYTSVDAYDLSEKNVNEFSQNFGQNIYELNSKMSAIQDLRIDYILMGATFNPVNGKTLTGTIRKAIENLLNKKKHSLKNLRNSIHLLTQQHIFDDTLKMTYPDSNVNASVFKLMESARFNGMMINLSMSTVHIPDKVFEKSPEVLNGVAWSTRMDAVFETNIEDDYHSKWQFFCSAHGFLRMFPGATWQKTRSNQIHPNAYDCRMQKWYIQASTSPKAVVFVVDVGDGMKKKMSFAEKTLKYFLDSLADEDLFNVIYFSSSIHYPDACFNASFVYATNNNKKKVLSYMEEFKWVKSKSKYETAMSEALSLFSQLNNTVYNSLLCSKVVVLITASVTEEVADVISNYNSPLFNVRTFIYLLQRHKTSMEVAKKIACSHKGYHASLEADEDIFEQILNFINILSTTTIKTIDHHHHHHRETYSQNPQQHHVNNPNDHNNRHDSHHFSHHGHNHYDHNNKYEHNNENNNNEHNRNNDFVNDGGYGSYNSNDENDGNYRKYSKNQDPYENNDNHQQPKRQNSNPYNSGNYNYNNDGNSYNQHHKHNHMDQHNFPYIWTNVYEDTAGLDLVMTLASPVYEGNKFIGVVGVDTAIDEFADLFNKFPLGVDSKAFIINNKGHTVYHPDFKTKSKYRYEFSFNPTSNLVDIEHLEHSKSISVIKERMMRGDDGYENTDSIQLYENYNRVSMKSMIYYFKKIGGSPFRFGIALPSAYDRAWLSGIEFSKDYDFSAWSSEQFLLSQWDYCNIEKPVKAESKPESLLRTLHEFQKGLNKKSTKFYTTCNEAFVKYLLFDIEASRGALNIWMKENWNYNLSKVRNDGADLVYLETKSGLIRYHIFNQTNDKLEEYMELVASNIHTNSYSKAVLSGEEIITYSLPFTLDTMMKSMTSSSSSSSSSSSYQLVYQPPSKLYTANPDDILITASQPIIIHENEMEVVVGVVNTLLRFSWFKKILNNSIPYCNNNHMRCSRMCEAEEVDCYLLDSNAYVVYSENLAEVGQFFGELEGCASSLWNDLVLVTDNDDREKSYKNKKRVYHKIEITDHHAVCEVIRKSASRSAPFTDYFSIANAFKYFLWIVNEFFLCIFQFDSMEGCFFRKSKPENTSSDSISSIDFPDEVPYVDHAEVFGSSEEETSTDLESYRSLMSDLVKISSLEQVEKWKENCLRQSSYSSDGTVSCLKNIKKAYEPGILGYRPCVQSYVRYLLDPTNLPLYEYSSNKELCSNSYSITVVPRTNLILLTMDSMCECGGNTQQARMRTSELHPDKTDLEEEGEEHDDCNKFKVHHPPSEHVTSYCSHSLDETNEEEYYCGESGGRWGGEGSVLLMLIFLMLHSTINYYINHHHLHHHRHQL